jgi:hypothetical protein
VAASVDKGISMMWLVSLEKCLTWVVYSHIVCKEELWYDQLPTHIPCDVNQWCDITHGVEFLFVPGW